MPSAPPKYSAEMWRKIKGAEASLASHANPASTNPDTAIIPWLGDWVEIDNTGSVIRKVPWPKPPL